VIVMVVRSEDGAIAIWGLGGARPLLHLLRDRTAEVHRLLVYETADGRCRLASVRGRLSLVFASCSPALVG
jgi:hypothetical protein